MRRHQGKRGGAGIGGGGDRGEAPARGRRGWVPPAAAEAEPETAAGGEGGPEAGAGAGAGGEAEYTGHMLLLLLVLLLHRRDVTGDLCASAGEEKVWMDW